MCTYTYIQHSDQSDAVAIVNAVAVARNKTQMYILH
jgi:hypothetical protein